MDKRESGLLTPEEVCKAFSIPVGRFSIQDAEGWLRDHKREL